MGVCLLVAAPTVSRVLMRTCLLQGCGRCDCTPPLGNSAGHLTALRPRLMEYTASKVAPLHSASSIDLLLPQINDPWQGMFLFQLRSCPATAEPNLHQTIFCHLGLQSYWGLSKIVCVLQTNFVLHLIVDLTYHQVLP